MYRSDWYGKSHLRNSEEIWLQTAAQISLWSASFLTFFCIWMCICCVWQCKIICICATQIKSKTESISVSIHCIYVCIMNAVSDGPSLSVGMFCYLDFQPPTDCTVLYCTLILQGGCLWVVWQIHTYTYSTGPSQDVSYDYNLTYAKVEYLFHFNCSCSTMSWGCWCVSWVLWCVWTVKEKWTR